MKQSIRNIVALFGFMYLCLAQLQAQTNCVVKRTDTLKYKYCHQSGDTLRTLHIRGLGTNMLHFALYEKVGKKSFGLIAKGRAKMTSDSEQDENAEGEPVFSQEYWYEADSLLYSLRTDGEKNTFIRFQIYIPNTPASKPLHHYFMKCCK